MRVCYFGTYREEYSRNQIMIEALRQVGTEVIECHEPLWQGVEDRVQAASGGWFHLAFAARVIKVYWRLLQKYRSVGDYDIMIVGYPGQVDVFLARWLTWFRRKPLVWDIFMSIYLIALERGLDKRSRLTIWGLRWIEWIALRLPDLLIMDTEEYVEWFTRIHGVAAKQFRLVPTGADDRVFQPQETAPSKDGFFHVLYYGTFIPNHGTCYIIEAAHLLMDDPSIRFEMVGDGPERDATERLVSRYGLRNVSFIQWLDKPSLVCQIAQADVCLGAFGTTPQSLMTVQNKIYEALAMARPVITGESPATCQVFEHGKHVYLCGRENPQELAKAILTLYQDKNLREKLSHYGYEHYLHQFTIKQLGLKFRDYLDEVVGNTKKETNNYPEKA